jgi:hypothetical protein
MFSKTRWNFNRNTKIHYWNWVVVLNNLGFIAAILTTGD